MDSPSADRVASLAALLRQCVRSLEFAEIWLRKIGDTDGANAMLRTLEKARGVQYAPRENTKVFNVPPLDAETIQRLSKLPARPNPSPGMVGAAQGLGEPPDVKPFVEIVATAVNELYELAQKYRNDWSDFDGRQLKKEIGAILDPVTNALDAERAGRGAGHPDA